MSDYSHLLRWQCPLRGTKFMREDFCDKRRALNHIKTSKKGVLLEKGIEADKKCLECEGPTSLEKRTSSKMGKIKVETAKVAKRWMSVEELAVYLNIGPRTIYNRCGPKAKNPLPFRAHRLGGRVLFDLQEVDREMERL